MDVSSDQEEVPLIAVPPWRLTNEGVLHRAAGSIVNLLALSDRYKVQENDRLSLQLTRLDKSRSHN